MRQSPHLRSLIWRVIQVRQEKPATIAHAAVGARQDRGGHHIGCPASHVRWPRSGVRARAVRGSVDGDGGVAAGSGGAGRLRTADGGR
jgi:hypothetical protein